MGCGAVSVANEAVIQPTTHPTSALEAGQLIKANPQDVNTRQSLKNFNLIWLDAKKEGVVTEQQRSNLSKLFNKITFASIYSEFESKMNLSTKLMIFVSSVEKFIELKQKIESKDLVVGICIFDPKIEEHQHFKNESPKVIEIVNTLDDLKKAFQKISISFTRRLRFYDEREERTFYGLEDKETIKKSLRVAIENDSFTIFYPLGMKAVKIEDHLTKANCLKIEECARGDTELKTKMESKYAYSNYMDFITAVTSFLQTNNQKMIDIIKSYTKDNLYYMLNLYLRYGKFEGFELFKEYMFCLKGSMCQKGKPVIKAGLKVYRGLDLGANLLKKYEEKKSKCILLNGFTSTTHLEEKAMEFASWGCKDTATVMEITLVDFDDLFLNFLKDFEFPEENGVFFPVDISEFSEYPKEKEVLFPPFYPIRILDVIKYVRGTKIIAEAPFSVSVAGKDWIINAFKNRNLDKHLERSYIEEILDFVKKEVIDNLSFGNEIFIFDEM